jgi:trimethylamine--corrinoid protein Co-methyltransferase
MSERATARPRLSLFREDELQRVHDASLRILSEVGVRVDSPVARDALAKAGGRIKDDRCALDAETVAAALAAAPRAVTVFDRLGAPAFTLGADRARFGIGVTNLYYEDPESGDIRPFRRADLAASVRLGHALSEYDCVSTVGVLQDEPVERADLVATLEMAANTTKPLVLLISDPAQFAPALDLLEVVAGLSHDRPCVLPYVNPITPLALNAETTEKMAEAVARRLPVIFSNYGMAGASTPVSPLGTLVLLNAELLAGLVFSQALRPGAAVIPGSLPAYFDMRTMVDYYDPRSMLINLACSEMMAWYGLPHVGTSGSGTGWAADVIAAGELWFNHLVSVTGSSGLVPFVGGNFGSKVFSPASAVYGAEVIAQARVFAAGIGWEEEAALIAEVTAAAPAGSFFESQETLRRLRTGYHTSRIFPHYGVEKWTELGRPSAEARLGAKTVDLLRAAQPPEDGREVIGRGQNWIDARRP